MLERYFTGFWYKPDQFPFSIVRGSAFHRMNRHFRKRYFPEIDPKLVHQLPGVEMKSQILRKISDRLLYRHIYSFNEKFDLQVSRELHKYPIQGFVGYETSALECFHYCRQNRLTTILDLAQVHHASHALLQAGGYDPFRGDERLRQRFGTRFPIGILKWCDVHNV